MSNQQKFLELFEPNKMKLWRFCLSISRSRDNAKDLLQDTIEAAFKQFDDVKSEQAFLSYLFTIASRINYKQINRLKKLAEIDDSILEALIDGDALPDTQTDIRILYESLDKMKYEQREAIILSEIMGLQHLEAAKIQGITLETFRQRLYRAKNTLKEIMNPQIQGQFSIPNELKLRSI